MSSDDNHRQAHMTPTARKICGVFALQRILFHIIVVEGHYMPCSIEAFFCFLKKVKQSCLTMV